MTVFKTVLVIGPTGAGKSPLGDHIEKHGFLGARAGHFDFGENLRSAAADPTRYPALDQNEVGVIRNVLERGALLEDNQFSIVEKLFAAFAERFDLGPEEWVLLNGMPRHVGQAEAVARFADVRYVANLVCDEGMVLERIRTNAGGDRIGRVDDDLAAVRNKLDIFKRRTLPLLAHYREKGRVAVRDIPIDLTTRPATILTRLSA